MHRWLCCRLSKARTASNLDLSRMLPCDLRHLRACEPQRAPCLGWAVAAAGDGWALAVLLAWKARTCLFRKKLGAVTAFACLWVSHPPRKHSGSEPARCAATQALVGRSSLRAPRRALRCVRGDPRARCAGCELTVAAGGLATARPALPATCRPRYRPPPPSAHLLAGVRLLNSAAPSTCRFPRWTSSCRCWTATASPLA